MSDRYKDEIENILQSTPDLPEEHSVTENSPESIRDHIINIFYLSRERKLGPLSSFSSLALSGLAFLGFMVTKFNVLAVLSITFLLVSYLTFVCHIFLQRPRVIRNRFKSWWGGLPGNRSR